MRAYAQTSNLTEVEVIQDLDVSGRSFTRAGLDRVLGMAADRRFDVLVIADLSRLGRNTAESLRTVAQLRDLGVRVMSTVEQIDDTPEGQFLLTQFLAIAQLYSDQMGRRWQQTLTRVTDQGLWPGAAQIGYQRVESASNPTRPSARRSRLCSRATRRDGRSAIWRWSCRRRVAFGPGCSSSAASSTTRCTSG